MPRRAHDEGLVGDDHAVGCGIVIRRVERGEVALADLGVIGRKHIRRPRHGPSRSTMLVMVTSPISSLFMPGPRPWVFAAGIVTFHLIVSARKSLRRAQWRGDIPPLSGAIRSLLRPTKSAHLPAQPRLPSIFTALLRAFLAGLLEERHACTGRELRECAIEDGVAVKVDFAAVVGLQEAEAGTVDLLHRRDRRPSWDFTDPFMRRVCSWSRRRARLKASLMAIVTSSRVSPARAVR